MKTDYKCIACRDTGCKDAIDHDTCGAGCIGPDPIPCPICNPDDKIGQVAEQIARADEWNAGLSAMYNATMFQVLNLEVKSPT